MWASNYSKLLQVPRWNVGLDTEVQRWEEWMEKPSWQENTDWTLKAEWVTAGWETGKTIQTRRQKGRGRDAMRTWWFRERWEERLEGRSWRVGDASEEKEPNFRKIRLGSDWRSVHRKQRGQIGECCNSPRKSQWQSQLVKKGHLHWLGEMESDSFTRPMEINGEKESSFFYKKTLTFPPTPNKSSLPGLKIKNP